MKKCYIVGAGELYSVPNPTDEDLVIAADGGYAHLISHGVRCDLLVGDLDSLGYAPDVKELVRHPVEKDETDMHLGYLEGVKRGYTEFVLIGGVGGADDHTYANISLLLLGRKNGHRITLVGERSDARVIENESVTLNAECKKRLSIFAIGGDARGVTIVGAKYELLSPTTLTPEFALGVSNSFTGGEVTVSVEDGALLIYVER